MNFEQEKKIIWKKIPKIFQNNFFFAFFFKIPKWQGILKFDAWNRITK